MSRRDADPFVDPARPDPVFDRPGRTCAALRAVVWSDTPLGPVSDWPPDLHRSAHTVVRSSAPMLVWWGEQFVQVHNDAVLDSLGGEKPAVGRPAAECWPERWEVFGPHVGAVVASGAAVSVDDVVLPVDGDLTAVWTMTLAPLHVGGAVCGVLANAADLTARVTARRLEQQTADEANANLKVALATNRQIGTALGILMAHRRITEEAAFEVLREESQRTHRKLRDIAADVVLTGTVPGHVG